jgi:CelD/BcsL family acetyltransferase involved in cellulose biosynthesis
MLIDGIWLSATDNTAPLEDVWRSLEATHTTVFQRLDWCQSVLASRKTSPLIVMGTQEDGTPAFLLPFQIEGQKLQFLGQPDSIYGFGLFSDWAVSEAGLAWFDRNWPAVLRHGHAASIIDLRNMPSHVSGKSHPLLPATNIKDADTCTVLRLTGDFEDLLAARRGGEARSKMRNRDRRIADQGEVKFDELSTSPEAHTALDELFEDQKARLAENGIADPAGPTLRSTLHAMLDQPGKPLRVLRLMVGGQTLASLLTAYHADTVTFLMVSLAKTHLRKYSPGDLALRRAIAHAIELGYRRFDFSKGAASYKEHWQDEVVTLHHCIRSTKLTGLPSASLMAGKLMFKTAIKNSPWLWDYLYAIRRLLRAKV